MQRNLRIYLLHFFLNFLCGALFFLKAISLIEIAYKETISESTRIVVFCGVILNIFIATIVVNIVSFINFKESKCNPVISFLIYLILAYVGLVIPKYLYQYF